MSESREQVERAADRIREDFLATLKELERRRHQAMDFRYQVRTHRALLIGVGASVGALIAAAWGLARLKARRRRATLRQQRWKALGRAWRHPRRLATKAPGRPLPAELGRKASTAFLSALAVQLARRSATAMVPRRSDGDLT
jgi:hypothetical protein